MGKSSSKLKRTKFYSSFSLNRFASLPTRFKSRIHKINEHNNNHDKTKTMDIAKWLQNLDLEEYKESFSKYDGVEDILDLSETDIKNLGVKISSHRALMVHSLTVLRAKYYNNSEKEKNFKRQPSLRHSVAVDRNKSEDDDILTDLSTVSEVIQSKSLNNLIMEPMADTSMSAQELKKALEWELSLDSRDIRSHAWYHGAIPRSRAEDIVREEGGFLVRDCTSQPGNFVLTCRTKNQPLHFVINKLVLQPDTVYERVQYQFEDEAFDTVADLITFYVGSGKPVTMLSGARIQFPKNRMYPLSFYASKYPTPLPQSRLTSPATTPMGGCHTRHPSLTYYRNNNSSSSPTRNNVIMQQQQPRLPSKKQRSHSLTPNEVINRISHEKCNSADGVILSQSPSLIMTRSAGPETRFSTHSLPRISNNTKLSISVSSNTLGRNNKVTSSDSTLSPCAERKFFDENDPPPKPPRIPSRTESRDNLIDYQQTCGGFHHGNVQRVTSYHASGSDSGNGSGDSALSSAASGDPMENQRNSGVIIKNPRYNILSSSESSTTLKNFDFDPLEIEQKLFELYTKEDDIDLCTSRFDLENYQTLLLPSCENKPLDAQALRGIKMILKDYGSRILANHLTKADLDIIFHKHQKGFVELKNGLELCTLPHGHQFRLDLIERTECLKLLVAVTILTCSDELERTETLYKWIEIAIDTKTALGNLFGFCGIMLGLCLPQIEKLDTTWHMLRQKYTEVAFNFESKLRPTLKNMNNCSNPQAPNTTIPHLLPFIVLLERNLEDFQINNDQISNLASSCFGFSEYNSQDFGLMTLLNHLKAARKYVDSSQNYLRNAEIVLGDARIDDLTLEMFQTEFHLKFLWGSRGAVADSTNRHAKFDQILTVMSEKFCNLNNKEESEV